MVAALVSLMNDARISRGLPPMGMRHETCLQQQVSVADWLLVVVAGFINPWLYQTAATYSDAFLDITSGSNPYSCCTGFTCQVGWDPVTGLGAPNYATLVKYALNAFEGAKH
jgi:tripeptidyl-peptidase I